MWSKSVLINPVHVIKYIDNDSAKNAKPVIICSYSTIDIKYTSYFPYSFFKFFNFVALNHPKQVRKKERSKSILHPNVR